MAKQRLLEEGDLECIAFFWSDKGDVTCWLGWEEVQDDLRRKHPAIVTAWNNYIASKQVLDAVLAGIA